jgi:hypothetical protein
MRTPAFLLLTVLLWGSSGKPPAIPVKVVVDGTDNDFNIRIRSKINNQLHTLEQVQVTDDESATFRINANAAVISCNTSKTIVLNVILTRKIAIGTQTAFRILSSTTKISEAESVENTCVGVIAQFDITFFEPERR